MNEMSEKVFSINKKFAPQSTIYVNLRTYGCQMNILDSEIITGLLANLGYKFVDDENQADAIIFNTCSVRDLSERKVLGKLGSLNLKRKTRPEIVLGVCGCMAELSSERLLKKNPHIDFACGTRYQDKIPELLANAFIKRISTAVETKHNAEHLSRIKKAFSHLIPALDFQSTFFVGFNRQKMSIDERIARRARPWATFVEIVRGCSNFCSYCVVPYARGPEISRLPEDILDEINELAKNGCVEITLLGQNVNSYGKDLRDEKISLANLLKEVQKVEKIKRIRFLTSNPQDISDELISAIAECDKICHHIHFPLQSGSDKILKMMKRKYSLAEYFDKINKLKKAVPDIAFSSDFIVGFPSESDEDFNLTCAAMEQIRYASSFLFKYSVRNGTAAAKLTDDVPEETKKARHKILLDLQNKLTYEHHKSLVGKTVEVLIDGRSKRNPRNAQGRSRRYFNVVVEDAELSGGELVNVKITRATKLSLYGKIEK